MTAALAALAMMAGAIMFWLLSDEPAIAPGAPRYAAGTVTVFDATLAPISDFDHQFNVNDENPFLPIDRRIADHIARQPKPPIVPPNPDNNVTQIKPNPVPIPVLVLPPAAAHGPSAPECHGLLTIGTTQVLLLRMPGSDSLQQVTVGDAIAETNAPDRRWTLLGFTANSVAHWRDPDGVEQVFPIANGLNDTVGTEVVNDTPANPAPATTPAPANPRRPTPAAPPMGIVPAPPGAGANPDPPGQDPPGHHPIPRKQ
jgi:hypothetical protein